MKDLQHIEVCVRATTVGGQTVEINVERDFDGVVQLGVDGADPVEQILSEAGSRLSAGLDRSLVVGVDRAAGLI